jgi:hypothetical protein
MQNTATRASLRCADESLTCALFVAITGRCAARSVAAALVRPAGAGSQTDQGHGRDTSVPILSRRLCTHCFVSSRTCQLLQILGSPAKDVRSTSAVVIGTIAAVEVPKKMWPDLIQSLITNIAQARSSDAKQSSYEALGYVCEEVRPRSLHLFLSISSFSLSLMGGFVAWRVVSRALAGFVEHDFERHSGRYGQERDE